MISVEEYRRPLNVEEALGLMSSGNFVPIAGGTDLIPYLRTGNSVRLLDIARLGYNFIHSGDGVVEIGSAVTHSALAQSSIIMRELPLLALAAASVGTVQVRNRGTVGGNVVNASPCADTVPPLLIYDTEILLVSRQGVRNIKLADFISRPYTVNRQPDELLHCFRCKPLTDHTGHSFQKLGRRQAVNISRMSLAISLRLYEGRVQSARISGGSIFPVPERIEELEKLLASQSISPELIDEAANLAGELMVRRSGLRWSTPYKKPVLIGLMKRALFQAAGDLQDR